MAAAHFTRRTSRPFATCTFVSDAVPRGPSRNGCVGFYFSFHPDFERTRLIALPQSLGGVRIVEFQPGKMIDAASFVPVVADVWLTFWIDEEFFYALSTSGEVYILRYVP